MNEVWKPVSGFENYYEVSSLGAIRSVSRVVDFGCRKRKTPAGIIKPWKDKNGYACVSLWAHNKGVSKKIHRLVANAFIPNPTNKPQVNHKNGIKSDNRVENLEWVSAQENMRHSFDVLGRVGTWKGRFGGLHSQAKAVAQIKERVVLAKYDSAASAARATGYSRGLICTCCRGEQKQAYGYEWRYV